MGLKTILMKNKTLLYIVRCCKNYREKNSYYVNVLDPYRTNKESFIIKSQGESYPDLVIYYIRVKSKRMGMFAIYRWILAFLYVADRFHFVPYIEVDKSIYTDKDDDNMFEYYWKQPLPVEIGKVKTAKNLVESQMGHGAWFHDIYGSDSVLVNGYDIDECSIRELSRIRKKYIFYKPEIENILTSEAEILLNNKKTLAVHYRGADFKVGFQGHPIPLTEEEYFPFIDEALSEGFEQIFLATDDQGALMKFTTLYGERIVYYHDLLRSDTELGVHYMKTEKTGFRVGYEVLRDMYTLSKCDGIVCGKSHVSYSARIEKLARDEEYVFQKVIDKGNYAKNAASVMRERKHIMKYKSQYEHQRK